MASLSKNELKTIRSLHRKKGRNTERAFIVEGEKLVAEAYGSRFKVLKTLKSPRLESDVLFEESTSITEKEMAQISMLSSPSPLLAVVQMPDEREVEAFYSHPTILILDDISDPGNLGTIIRTADWFGIGAIVMSDSSVDPFNPKVVQASMGSIFRVTLLQTDLAPFIQTFKAQTKAKVFGAVLDGSSIDLLSGEKGQKALVIGSESHGISEEILPLCDQKIAIKRVGEAESLNAAIATSILLFETTR